MRWINDEKARYYQAHLVVDLFGDWTLIRVWGGLGSRRGGMRVTGVASYEDGLTCIREIAKRRRRHGYRRSSDGVDEGLPTSGDLPANASIGAAPRAGAPRASSSATG
jgi:hypothetical protein